MKKIVPIILAVVVILGGSMAVYAYESPEVTNGSALYGLKRTIEAVEEGFVSTPSGKVSFHAKMTLRRIEEEKVLEKRGQPDPETIANIEKSTHLVMEQFVPIADSSEAQGLILEFKAKLKNHKNGTLSADLTAQLEDSLRDVDELTGDAGRKEMDNANNNTNSIGNENTNLNGGENKNANANLNTNNNSHSEDVNKGQQGMEKSVENANPQANMNAKVEQRGENKNGNGNKNNAGKNNTNGNSYKDSTKESGDEHADKQNLSGEYGEKNEKD